MPPPTHSGPGRSPILLARAAYYPQAHEDVVTWTRRTRAEMARPAGVDPHVRNPKQDKE
ncbi:hypothetical protein Sme01_62450 [Sphaerisporangium melleum]|uniref:Uncharacterized protein n=1 Tax=Sphaerisporangium melleum TaxID=321316 RepID=A0A917R1I3_9ACTN|nr:hypothetical protein GCM10007964_25890 [Sphaerisporangium melleum]GII73769.1 hypothetical protein Sme01_62450 [Sphaerisporangium melleum]